jgi:hypothetical protein
MVNKLSQMFENVEVAFDILTTSSTRFAKYCLMLRDGFKPQSEPHLRDMLSCISVVQLEEIFDKM